MKRIDGIDYIKAIMSVFVVAWHSGAGGATILNDKSNALNYLYSFSDFFSFQILLLAVPLFMLTSNYLFVIKSPTIDALKKTMWRYVLILAFWVPITHLIEGSYEELFGIFPTTASRVLPFILSGGHTLYYFIVSLMLTQLIVYIFFKSDTKVLIALLFVSCILVLVTPLASIQFSAPRLNAHWNPMNFLPYPFVAILLHRYSDLLRQNYLKVIPPLLVLTALLGFFEWGNYRDAVTGYPAYTRVSLVLGSAIVMITALMPFVTGNRVIYFMSDHSFGLYALHRLVKIPLFPILIPVFMKFSRDTLIPSVLMRWVAVLVVVLISYLISVFLKKVLRSEII